MTRRVLTPGSRMLAVAAAVLVATATLGGVAALSALPHADTSPAASLPPLEAEPLHYRGALGGLYVADATLVLRGDSQVYQGDLDITTRGVLWQAFRWMGALQARGEIHDGTLRPTGFERRFLKADDVEEMIVRYEPDGTAQGVEDGTPANHDTVPEHLRRDTMDPLAALLALRREVAAGRTGTVVLPVFDGSARLDLIAEISGPATTTVNRRRHDVIRVRATVRPVAGFSDHQARNWSSGSMRLDFTADARAIPVRITVGTPIGAAVLTLK